MKKIFGLLFLVLLMGCDDGDATVEAVTFDDSNAEICGDLIYRITENRVMIMKLAENSDLFTNDVTVVPRTASIPGGATVNYRVYSGTLTSDAICTSPPPLTPVAVLEWPATRGTVEVTTTAVESQPNAETGQTKITQYKHRIVFKGLDLSKPDGTFQNYPEYVFGNYFTTANNLPFSFDSADVAICPDTNLIYKAQNSGAEGLYIQNFDAGLLDTTILGTPKTFNIGPDQNAVIYRLLDFGIPSGQNANYFCGGSASPSVKEQWQAVSGTIEVVTLELSGHFEHTIKLKNVVFKKGNSTFQYGPDRLYGTLQTE